MLSWVEHEKRYYNRDSWLQMNGAYDKNSVFKRSYSSQLFLINNGVARTLKKVCTPKGDYWIKHMILFNCFPFQNGNSSKKKEFAARGSKVFPFIAVSYGKENHVYHMRWPPLNVTIFSMYMGDLRNGHYANDKKEFKYFGKKG